MFGLWDTVPHSSAGESYLESLDSISYVLTIGSECWCWFGGVWKKEMKRTFNEVLVRAKHFHTPTFLINPLQVDTVIPTLQTPKLRLTEMPGGKRIESEPFSRASCASVPV